MKEVFSTGEVAFLLRVSQQAIIKAVDSNELKGFKVPGSKFRKIPKIVLVEYMKNNNYPEKWIREAEER